MKSVSYINDFETWKSDFSFSLPIKVRFSETDLYGHVNNTSVFVYFEEARIEYLRHLGFFNEQNMRKYGFVVADLQCDYLLPLFFNETIHFSVKVETIGNSSLDIHYLATKENGEPAATGRGRIVMMDLKNKKPMALPEEFKGKLIKETNKQQV